MTYRERQREATTRARTTIFAILAGLFLVGTLPADAGVPLKNEVIELAGDGNLYSPFPDGNVDPTPPYEALHLNIGTKLADCGWLTLVHGTGDACEVRSGFTGTNAATCTMSIENELGDDATDAGHSAESAGAGNEILFSSATNTDKAGSFAIKCDDGISSETSINKNWAMQASANPDPPIARDVLIAMDFETGEFNADGFLEDGVSVDAASLQLLVPDTTFTIDDISDNDSTASIHWSAGTDCTNDKGFSLGVVASGMTQVSERMFRCENVNAGANTADLWQDGDDDGKPYSGAFTVSGGTLPTQRTSTVGYGTWTGTVTATTWRKQTFASGGLGPSETSYPVRVVQSVTPPTNLEGSASQVTPLRGSWFLDSRIDFWRPWDEYVNSTTTNPRYNITPDNEHLDLDYNEEAWFGFALYLPTNYAHNTGGDYNGTVNQLFLIGEAPNNIDNGIFDFKIRGTASGVDQFAVGIGTASQGTITGTTNIGAVGAGHIGHWTCVVVRLVPHASSGTAQVWMQPRCEDDDDGDIALVYSRTGQAVGFDPGEAAYDFMVSIRMYKYGWPNHADSTPGPVWWMGRDEIFMGTVNSSTGFADVHAHGSAQP